MQNSAFLTLLLTAPILAYSQGACLYNLTVFDSNVAEFLEERGVSRIIAVADAYNAMTSDRPYRDAMPSRVARLRLAQAADSQFETAAVAAFEAILAGADEEYRLARRADFQAFVHKDVDSAASTFSAVADVA